MPIYTVALFILKNLKIISKHKSLFFSNAPISGKEGSDKINKKHPTK